MNDACCVYICVLTNVISSQQNEAVTEQEASEVQAKTDRDITAVQSLLAMSQWSPPSPEHSILTTNDPLFSLLDPIHPYNIQLSPDKVRKLLSFCCIFLINCQI
jgi:hypothetical protein